MLGRIQKNIASGGGLNTRRVIDVCTFVLGWYPCFTGTCLGNSIFVIWSGTQRWGKVGGLKQKVRPVLVITSTEQVDFP